MTSSPDPVSQAAMRRFWARMAAIYGHKWVSAYGERCEDDAGALTVVGDTWRRGLLGVSEARIGAGLNACIASVDPWPPTLPQFRALCLSIPPLALVRAELRPRGADATPFGLLVRSHIDTFRFRLADADRADRMVAEAYEAACAHVMRGGALPEVLPAIAPPEESKPKPADPEVVERVRRELDAKLRASEAAEREIDEPGEPAT